MFKRRDWVHLKGRDGQAGGADSGSSDDDDDSEERQEQPPSSAEASEQEDEQEDDESLSEDGDVEGSEGSEPELTAADVVRVWTSDDPEISKFKGIPLRCEPCKVMLLNRSTYLQHVNTKVHKAKLKAGNVTDADAIQSASDHHEETDDAETHAERLERLKHMVASVSPAVAVTAAGAVAAPKDNPGGAGSLSSKATNGKKNGRATSGTALAGEQPSSKPSNGHGPGGGSEVGTAHANGGKGTKRLGKRQRAALKAEGKDPATGKKFRPRKPKAGSGHKEGLSKAAVQNGAQPLEHGQQAKKQAKEGKTPKAQVKAVSAQRVDEPAKLSSKKAAKQDGHAASTGKAAQPAADKKRKREAVEQIEEVQPAKKAKPEQTEGGKPLQQLPAGKVAKVGKQAQPSARKQPVAKPAKPFR